jgi:hypothetical protein
MSMPKKNARTRSGSATLFSVKKEMAKPCVAHPLGKLLTLQPAAGVWL